MHWRKRMNVSNWLLSKLPAKSHSAGLMLLLGVMLILGLSGCGKTVVVRAECPAYPQLPQELLDYKSAAEKAGLVSPLGNAKP